MQAVNDNHQSLRKVIRECYISVYNDIPEEIVIDKCEIYLKNVNQNVSLHALVEFIRTNYLETRAFKILANNDLSDETHLDCPMFVFSLKSEKNKTRYILIPNNIYLNKFAHESMSAIKKEDIKLIRLEHNSLNDLVSIISESTEDTEILVEQLNKLTKFNFKLKIIDRNHELSKTVFKKELSKTTYSELLKPCITNINNLYTAYKKKTDLVIEDYDELTPYIPLNELPAINSLPESIASILFDRDKITLVYKSLYKNNADKLSIKTMIHKIALKRDMQSCPLHVNYFLRKPSSNDSINLMHSIIEIHGDNI